MSYKNIKKFNLSKTSRYIQFTVFSKLKQIFLIQAVFYNFDE